MLLALWLTISCMILVACCLVILACYKTNGQNDIRQNTLIGAKYYALHDNYNYQKVNKTRNKIPAIAILTALIPCLTFVLYFYLGSSYELQLNKKFNNNLTTTEVDELIQQWAKHRPNNEMAKWLLAKQQVQSGNYKDAENSYKKLIKLNPDASVYYSELAQLLFLTDNLISTEIQSLYKQALKLDANDTTALELQGIDFFLQKQYELAKSSWLLALEYSKDDNIEAQQALKSGILQTRKILGEAIVEIKVAITIQDKLTSKLSGNERVFLFARLTNKKSPPIAATATKVNKLPTIMILDDSSISMNPIVLSEAKTIDIIARISKSQDAMQYEYEVVINDITVTNNLELQINFSDEAKVLQED